MHLSMSNKGWHSQWFYLKNAVAAPLSEFTERLIEEALESWSKWGVLEKDKKKIWDHITAIHILKECGLKGSGVIGAYHTRRGALPNSEIVQRIKDAIEPSRDNAAATLDFVFLVPGHPPMWPELGHVVFISFPFSCLLFNRFPNLLILTLRGARPAKGPHLHGSPSAIAKGFVHEGGESRQG